MATETAEILPVFQLVGDIKRATPHVYFVPFYKLTKLLLRIL